ncbi:hypothetical protein HK100_006193 [Physocladia obscura]|uniref:PX domain-containing protein n=1 Tax=Physocladia obscura TaxID=109957 RepID=A0AAD5T5B3_9FUNG|nr:hypothetical protein HK100_006193 [Physocladia obscura]
MGGGKFDIETWLIEADDNNANIANSRDADRDNEYTGNGRNLSLANLALTNSHDVQNHRLKRGSSASTASTTSSVSVASAASIPVKEFVRAYEMRASLSQQGSSNQYHAPAPAAALPSTAGYTPYAARSSVTGISTAAQPQAPKRNSVSNHNISGTANYSGSNYAYGNYGYSHGNGSGGGANHGHSHGYGKDKRVNHLSANNHNNANTGNGNGRGMLGVGTSLAVGAAAKTKRRSLSSSILHLLLPAAASSSLSSSSSVAAAMLAANNNNQASATAFLFADDPEHDDNTGTTATTNTNNNTNNYIANYNNNYYNTAYSHNDSSTNHDFDDDTERDATSPRSSISSLRHNNNSNSHNHQQPHAHSTLHVHHSNQNLSQISPRPAFFHAPLAQILDDDDDPNLCSPTRTTNNNNKSIQQQQRDNNFTFSLESPGRSDLTLFKVDGVTTAAVGAAIATTTAAAGNGGGVVSSVSNSLDPRFSRDSTAGYGYGDDEETEDVLVKLQKPSWMSHFVKIIEGLMLPTHPSENSFDESALIATTTALSGSTQIPSAYFRNGVYCVISDPKYDEELGCIQYTVSCTYGNDEPVTIVLEKRYSDFRKLYLQLKREYSSQVASWPEFPPKSYFKRFGTVTVRERLEAFAAFTTFIVLHPVLYNSPAFLEFLNVF